MWQLKHKGLGESHTANPCGKIIWLLDFQPINYTYLLPFILWTLHFSCPLRNSHLIGNIIVYGYLKQWLPSILQTYWWLSKYFCIVFYLTFPSRYSIFSCTSSSLFLLSWCNIDLLDNIDFGGYIMKTSQSVLYKQKCFSNIFINFNQLCKNCIYFHTHKGKLPWFLVLPCICNEFWSFSHN